MILQIKTLLHTVWLLAFKIVESLQCILKQTERHFKYCRSCDIIRDRCASIFAIHNTV